MEGLGERGSDGSGVYFPLYQYAPYLSNCFLLRGYDNEGRSLEPVFRSTLRRIDSRIVVRNVATPEESIQAFLAPRRMTGTLFLIFGGVSVILAAIGVYGVVSFSVTRKGGSSASVLPSARRQERSDSLLSAMERGKRSPESS